jgi:hypothetical protein
MNERIQKLIEQCTIEYRDGNGGYVDQVDAEKLAELIVRECSNFLKDTLDDHFAAEQLEEHFGVEE